MPNMAYWPYYDYQGKPILLVLFLIRFLALHDPTTVMLRIFFLSLLCLHRLLHLKLLGDVATFNGRLSLLNNLQPLLHLRERIQLNTSPLGPIHPRETRQVSYTILAPDQPQPLPFGLLFRKPRIQNAIQSLRLGLIATDGIIDFLGGIAEEVVRLALHGPDAGLHPGEPFDCLPVVRGVVLEAQFVGGIVAGGQVEEDCAAFEDALGWGWGLVDYGGDATVGWMEG